MFLYTSTALQKAWNIDKNWDRLIENLNEVLELKKKQKNNKQLQHEFSVCQHFFNDTEMENDRHSMFNFKLSKPDHNELNEKYTDVFDNLNCAPKKILAIGFSKIWTKMNINIFMLMKTTDSLNKLLRLICSKGDCSHFKIELKPWIC